MTTDNPLNSGWRDHPRYPDPAIETLDERFEQYSIFSAAVERLYTGCRWSEGPVWFDDGRYLLWSDIPNNQILKWEEETGSVNTFRRPSNFANGNNAAFNSRVYLWNSSTSAGAVTVRVFTLPLDGGLAQELTPSPLPLGTLEARSALNIKLAEDILTPLGVLLPYTTDGGNLTLEFTIQAADVRGTAQVFSSDFAFGTQPLQEIPATSSGSPTVLVANVTNGNSSVNDSRIYLWNPSTSAGEVTVRVFTLPVADGAVQQLVISSITQANPAVVTTSTDHGLVTGDEIRITGVIGMTEVNDREFVITVVDADEFSLNGEDSTGHTAYVFGGVVSLMGSRPLVLGTLGARSALNIKLAEDILMPL